MRTGHSRPGALGPRGLDSTAARRDDAVVGAHNSRAPRRAPRPAACSVCGDLPTLQAARPPPLGPKAAANFGGRYRAVTRSHYRYETRERVCETIRALQTVAVGKGRRTAWRELLHRPFTTHPPIRGWKHLVEEHSFDARVASAHDDIILLLVYFSLVWSTRTTRLLFSTPRVVVCM